MTNQCRRDSTSKVVSSRPVNILFLTTLLCSCGGGTANDSSTIDLAAAIPTAETGFSSTISVPVSSTDNSVVVTSNLPTDKESDLSIKEVVEIAIAAIDNPTLSHSSVDSETIASTYTTDEEFRNETDPVQPDEEKINEHPEKITDFAQPNSTADNDRADVESQLGSTLANEFIDGTSTDINQKLTFSGFQHNDLPDKYRPMFGCGGVEEDRWLSIANSWPRTWTVNSRSEFDTAVMNMEGGDRIFIEPGTDLGTVELASSGSPKAKKYIVGGSYCSDTSGPDSFSSNTRFTISGNDWVVMNLKFKPTGNKRAIHITGARNWVYNNRIDRAGEVLFTPRGTASSPTTSGNRVVGNYFNGANDAAGVRMLNPFTIKDAASVHDLVIGGNTFEDFQEPTYASKVITDTTFGWNYPYGSSTDLPKAKTYTELGWNHFIDVVGEVPTSKTSRWMIHNNLYESTPAYLGKDTPHVSLRAGEDKLIFRNIFLDGHSRVAQKSLEIFGRRSHGYYNVSFRSDNAGIGLGWTTTRTDSSFPFPENTMLRAERIENIDWRYNFFFGDNGNVASWARFRIISGYDRLLPPVNNSIRDNFYSSETPEKIILRVTDSAKSGLSDVDWENNNPDATQDLQHFARRTGDVSTLDGSVSIPTRVTVKGFWLDGGDVSIELPPWVSTSGDGLVDLID